MQQAATRKRKDGELTRQRILDSACEVFAERGYHNATVQMICRQAKANPALISYHFGDKASLYEAVWRQCADRACEFYPVDGGVSPDAPAEERFRGHVRTFVRCIADSGELSHLHRLNHLEMASPNAFISKVIDDLRQPHREYLGAVLKELLGPGATDEEVALCETSVVGQCRMARAGKGIRIPDLTTPVTPEESEVLAEHIAEFTLAGIRAMREQIEERGSRTESP